MNPEEHKKLLTIVDDLKKTMQCNCNLDSWEPERNTGHSWVCRIHKAAAKRYLNEKNNRGQTK